MTVTSQLSYLQTGVEAVAIVAFALSGLIEAARKRLDAVGVCFVAGLTAFGGGTLRDILLDRRPFFWVEHANWLWGILGLCICAMLFMRSRHFALTQRAMQWPDAVGLGLFSVNGTHLALVMGSPAIVAVLMGVVTAVFGSVLRDVVCNEIPSAFNDHRPSASCAFIGCWVFVGLDQYGSVAWGVSPEFALFISTFIVTALRLWVLYSGFTIPAWHTEETAKSTTPK